MRSLSATPPIDTAQANVLATQKLTARHDEIAELCSDLQFQNDLPDLSLQYNCGPAFQTTYHDGELQVLAAGEQKMLRAKRPALCKEVWARVFANPPTYKIYIEDVEFW